MTSIALASAHPYTEDTRVVTYEARQAQDLGYAALWRSGNLPMLAAAVRATTTIPVATGIIPTSRVPAADVISLHQELPTGRFVVGLGGAHSLAALNAYLDELDGAGIGSRVLAALGPNMLALARDRADGAYPYLVTPGYVAHARQILGPNRRLIVLLMTIPDPDREIARAAAAVPLEFLAGQGGYRRNLIRQGFTAADIDQVSDTLLDGIAAWGTPERIAERVGQYCAAGADQVVLRILGVDDIAAWRRKLAGTLIG